jgi:monoterpene epsilon-lactone hydrolase
MSTSAESEVLRHMYCGWTARMSARPDMSLEELRDLFEQWHRASREPEEVTYKSDVLASLDTIWAYPKDCDRSKVVLFFHGGGFSVGSPESHRKFAAHLAKQLGVATAILDYRRAPEHQFPAQLEDATRAYSDLLERGYAPQNVTFAGDSAGGNLSIVSALKLRDNKVSLPGSVIVFSPWLDMEHVAKTLETNGSADALVNKAIAQAMSDRYLGDRALATHPLANPLKASFGGFPRLHISVGSAEGLLDNSLDLSRIAKDDGVDVTLSIVQNMQHVFVILAGRASEADDELRRVASWFKRG